MNESNLRDLGDITKIQAWDGVTARRVEGEQLTLAVVELDPDVVVPEHSHPAEQNGIVLSGQVTFRVGDEERVLGPGGTWQILGGIPHAATAGPEGAVLIDAFSPPRADWHALPEAGEEPPRWP